MDQSRRMNRLTSKGIHIMRRLNNTQAIIVTCTSWHLIPDPWRRASRVHAFSSCQMYGLEALNNSIINAKSFTLQGIVSIALSSLFFLYLEQSIELSTRATIKGETYVPIGAQNRWFLTYPIQRTNLR